MIASYQNVEGFVAVSVPQDRRSGTWSRGLTTGSQGVIVVLGNRIGMPLKNSQSRPLQKLHGDDHVSISMERGGVSGNAAQFRQFDYLMRFHDMGRDSSSRLTYNRKKNFVCAHKRDRILTVTPGYNL